MRCITQFKEWNARQEEKLQMCDNAMDKIENFIKESKNNKTKTP